MPDAESVRKDAGGTKSQKARQRNPLNISPESTEQQNAHLLPEGLLGSDFSDTTFERHAAMLGDDALQRRANDSVRSQIVQQLQRDYGNQYVQRLLDNVPRKETFVDVRNDRKPSKSHATQRDIRNTVQRNGESSQDKSVPKPETGKLTADDLIKQFKNLLGANLKEEDLAKDLLKRMPTQKDLVFQVFRTLDREDRDDVAYYMLKNSSDDKIKEIATDSAWSQVRIVILGEISDGVMSDDEEAQRTRLLSEMPSDRPTQENQNQAKKQVDKNNARELIKRHTKWLNLHEKDLAKDLLSRLPRESELTNQVLDELGSTDRDDVSLELLKEASDDQVKRIASDTNGRKILLRMVHELYQGDMSNDEREQMQRAMKLITAIEKASRESKGGDVLEVEVITFLYGGKVLDSVGTVLGGMKGHTLIVIGELVYSFELGWSCGKTKAEYLADNAWRDGVGQVLNLPAEEVSKIQDHLNNSCGKGRYGISGDICTDSSAKALEKALTGLKSGWNPNLFIGQIEDTGKVKNRNSYPKSK